MPEPLDVMIDTQAIERWIDQQWLTLADLRRKDNTPERVEARRRIARYLHDHGWSESQIGRYLERDHTTIGKMLHPRLTAVQDEAAS